MKKIFGFLVFVIYIILWGFAQELIIAPNTYYQKFEQPPIISHIIFFDFPNENIEILNVLAQNQVIGKEKLSSMVKKYGADIGINTNYFSLDTGEPIGIFVNNGELIRLPIKRGAFGITYDGRAIIDIFETVITITVDDRTIKVDNLNTPRGGNQIVLYTRRFAKSSMIQKDAFAGINIIIEAQEKLPFYGKVMGKVVNIEYGVLSSNIPEKGFVLSLGGLALKYLPLFAIGKEISINVDSKPQILLKEAIGGGPILLKNGEMVLGKTEEQPFENNIIEGKHPRTIIGICENKIFFFVFEGRKENTPGVNLREAAIFLKNLGIENALNLDGGSSSNLVIWGEPLINNEREIASSLLIRNILPYTTPKYLTLFPKEDIYLQIGEKKKLNLILQDGNFHKLNIPLESLTWSVSSPIINFSKENLEIEGINEGEATLTLTLFDLFLEKKVFVFPEIFRETFEKEINWKVTGVNYDPSLTTYTLSSELSKEETKSLSLSYKTLPGNSFIYLEINSLISKNASNISLWVLGDNKKGWLRALFYDSNGKPYVLDLTPYKGIDWEGEWRLIEKDLSNLKPLISSVNSPPLPPLKLYAIYLVFLNSEEISGKIYIDDVKIY